MCLVKNSSDEGYQFNSKELFEISNREIHYEHTLISNRMTWYVTSQSFLIAAFFVSGAEGHKYQLLARILIPLLGIFTSGITLVSINAAIEAMERLRDYQAKIFRESENLQKIEPLNSRFKKNEESDKQFYKRVGWIHKNGLLPPKLIPLIFIFVWLCLFAITPC